MNRTTTMIHFELLDNNTKLIYSIRTCDIRKLSFHKGINKVSCIACISAFDIKSINMIIRQVWRTCQALMSKTGKESMMRKISKFDPRVVPLSSAAASRKILAPFSKEQIRDASAGAATFFIWVSSVNSAGYSFSSIRRGIINRELIKLCCF